MPEKYPDITWDNESTKLFEGGEYGNATASMIRACKCMNDLMIHNIKQGADPIQQLQMANDWLTKCLYSCNMNNYKKSDEPINKG